MKTFDLNKKQGFFKKTAITVITLLAVALFAAVSCAPNLEPHFEESWKEDITASLDPERNTSMTWNNGQWFPSVDALYHTSYGYNLAAAIPESDPDFPGGPYEGNNKIIVEFSPEADVFKGVTSGDELVEGMKNFIKFYTFTKTTNALDGIQDSISAGWAFTEIGYKFLKREGNNVYIELERKLTKNDSDIVYKIFASEYTYNNGMKIDADGNGITGEGGATFAEIGYDDYYDTLNVNYILRYNSGGVSYTDFMGPQNDLEYEIILVDLNPAQVPNDNLGGGTTKLDTSAARNIILSDFNHAYSGILTIPFLNDSNANNPDPYAALSPEDKAMYQKYQAAYDKFVGAFAGCFTIEKFDASTNEWVEHAKGVFNNDKPTSSETIGYKKIVAKNVVFTHGVAYRAAFNLGNVSLEMEDKIMGYNQRMKVTFGSDEITQRNKRTNIVTAPKLMYSNSDKVDAANANFANPVVIFHDYNNENVVFKFEMTSGYSTVTTGTGGLQNTTNYYYFKEDKQKFLDNFKIYSRTTPIYEIKISDIKFIQTNKNVTATTTVTGQNYVGANIVEITLDPSYRMVGGLDFSFYVGPGFVFANDTTRIKTASSSPNVWEKEGWFFLTGYFYLREDFEGVNSFTIVNGSQPNQWVVGTAAAYGGARSAYISNDGGTSNAYNINSQSTVHMYRDITFPASTVPYTLTFMWRCQGEGSTIYYDYLRVFLVPTSTTPTAGTQLTTGQIGNTYNLGGTTTWNMATISIPAYATSTTMRLVFSWRNDNSVGNMPPAAIDNITLTY